MQRDTLIADNVYLLEQGLELIAQLDDPLYVRASHPVTRFGVGSHFRHCLDFYQSFLAAAQTGRINYDLRERNALIEENRAAAMAKMEEMIAGLRGWPVTDGHQEVQVILEGSSRQGSLRWSRSSVMRELQFLLSHTIHHYALIAFALRLQGFDPGAEFGVAPSTLEHWRQAALCAR
jgi:hypothetical protein